MTSSSAIHKKRTGAQWTPVLVETKSASPQGEHRLKAKARNRVASEVCILTGCSVWAGLTVEASSCTCLIYTD